MISIVVDASGLISLKTFMSVDQVFGDAPLLVDSQSSNSATQQSILPVSFFSLIRFINSTLYSK